MAAQDAATIVAGDALLDPRAAPRLLLSLLKTGRLPDNVPEVTRLVCQTPA